MAKPRTTVYLAQQSARTLHNWNADRIRAAEIMAEAGNLQLASDIVEHLIFPDDRVQRCLDSKCNGLLGLPLTFEDGVGYQRRAARRAIEAQEDFWTIFRDAEYSLLLRWAAILNIGFGQLIYNTKQARWLPVVHPWSARNLRYDWHTRSWFVRTDGGQDVPVAPGDGKWVLFTPFGTERPWLHGPWRRLARLCLLKEYALTDWARHGQKAAGTQVATTETDAEDAKLRDLDGERQKICDDLSNAGEDPSIALPANWDLKLLSQPANTHETWVAQTDMCNAAIAIMLVGQNLTTEVKEGAKASTGVHSDVEVSKLQTWGSAVSTASHDQVLVWWSIYNFGTADVAPWPAWKTAKSVDTVAITKSWGTAADSAKKWLDLGLEPDLEAIAGFVSFPFIKRILPDKQQ